MALNTRRCSGPLILFFIHIAVSLTEEASLVADGSGITRRGTWIRMQGAMISFFEQQGTAHFSVPYRDDRLCAQVPKNQDIKNRLSTRKSGHPKPEARMLSLEFRVVDEGFADVLRTHDLGRTTLHPIDYVDDGHGYCEGGTFHLANLSEVRSFVVPLEEDKFRIIEPTMNILRTPRRLSGRPLPVACDGTPLPAMWREKPMPESLLFSKECGDALIAAGYGDALELAPCRYATDEDLVASLRNSLE